MNGHCEADSQHIARRQASMEAESSDTIVQTYLNESIELGGHGACAHTEKKQARRDSGSSAYPVWELHGLRVSQALARMRLAFTKHASVWI